MFLTAERTRVEDKLDVGETKGAACLVGHKVYIFAAELEGGIVDVNAPQACKSRKKREMHGQHDRQLN
jgi:hypothetical protein